MTIDEAIQHAKEVAEEKFNNAVSIMDKMKSDIALSNAEECKLCAEEHRQLAEWLKDYKRLKEQEPRWISVKEKLPEERLGVLVWCPSRKNIYCACYENKQWWIVGSCWDRVTSEIVAWMPLPKPYGVESEDNE